MTGRNLEAEVGAMIRQQKLDWELAKNYYASLAVVESRVFDFDGFRIVAQFNPERMRSSAAKTDALSIQQRACFLCDANRPKEQAGIDFRGKYTILVNPYPIFPEHLTIPLNKHSVQEIEPYFSDMLEFSKALPRFTVFYNGPLCGASAPDHFHFQAGNKQLMPVNLELDVLKERHGEKIFRNGSTEVYAVRGSFLRRLLLIVSSSATELHQLFQLVLDLLKERGQEGEPMLNILITYDDGAWTVLLFPRDKQRPDQFYEEGDAKIVMSPASVELAGIAVLPRKEDFEKMTKELLADIYSQITINERDFESLIEKIKLSLVSSQG